MKTVIRYLFLQIIIGLFFSFHVPRLSAADVDVSLKNESDKINKIESRLLSEKQNLNESKNKEKGLLSYIAELEMDIEQRKLTIDELQNKIYSNEVVLKGLDANLADMDDSLTKLEERTAERLVALYKYARKGYFKSISDVGSIDQLRRRVKYVGSVMLADRKILDGLAEEIKAYKQKMVNVKILILEERSKISDEKNSLGSLKNDLDGKIVRLMNIHQEKAFYETAVNELEVAAEDLKNTIQNIDNKEKYETDLPESFQDSKGKLSLPIKEGLVRKGSLFLGKSRMNYYKGVFIEGLSDAEVESVFPGRIDFSGHLKGYGEIIIVNHGSRYYTIFGNLARRDKKEGDLIEKGGIIGLVKKNSSENKARLYFEIRKDGKSLDPIEWLVNG